MNNVKMPVKGNAMTQKTLLNTRVIWNISVKILMITGQIKTKNIGRIL